MLDGVAVYVQLSSDGVVCKSRRLPPSPAAREATSVPIFDTSRNGVWPNARVAMNNDIVKPIPHRQLAPNNLRQERVSGLEVTPLLTANQENSVIPIGLPIHSPSKTPSPTVLARAGTSLPRTFTPALARANTGIITRDTQGCSPCSMRPSGVCNRSLCLSSS